MSEPHGPAAPAVTDNINPAPLNSVLSMRGVVADGIHRAAAGRVAVVNGTPIGREMSMSTSTITSIRKHRVAEHPESIFIRLWKQGTALELTRGLRFALDVEVGAAKVTVNSGRG
jgi:hypothetical protein